MVTRISIYTPCRFQSLGMLFFMNNTSFFIINIPHKILLLHFNSSFLLSLTLLSSHLKIFQIYFMIFLPLPHNKILLLLLSIHLYHLLFLHLTPDTFNTSPSHNSFASNINSISHDNELVDITQFLS